MRPLARTLAVAAFILFATAGVGFAVTGGVGVDNTVVLNDDQGPEVAVVTDGGEMGFDGPSTDGQVDVAHDNGEATISGTQGSTAQLDASEIEGTWTRATSLDTAGGELTIDPADKPALSVSGDISEVEFTDAALDDGSVDLRYLGTSSSVVTIRDLQPNTDIAAVVGGSQTITATTDGGGSVTLDLPESPSTSLTDVELVTTSSPDVDEFSASPQNGTTVSETPVQLNISVSDADFSTSQGDSVNVTFYDASDDSALGTTTLNANGTATGSFDDPSGGENTWYAIATDGYGNSVQSQTFSFQAPSVLQIRDEQTQELISGSDANVEVRFYRDDSNEVVRRNTTTGEISLDGLPLKELVVVADVEGYENRRIIIESIVEQSDIYLLNSSANTVQVEFELDDRTDQYEAESTRLFVEKSLPDEDGNNETETFQVIAGDFFGANNRYPVALESGSRYRLRVVNDDGDTRVLGSYTPTEPEITLLPIGNVELTAEVDGGTALQAGVRDAADTANHDYEIRVVYADLDNATDSFTLNVTDENGNQLRPETSETGPFGTYVETYPVQNSSWDPENNSATVSLTADRGGKTVTLSKQVGRVPGLFEDGRINSQILELMGIVSLVAIVGLLVIANPTIAAVVGVGYAGLLAIVGIVSIPAAAIGLAGSVAALFAAGGGDRT